MKKNLLATSMTLALLAALPAMAATDSSAPTVGERVDSGIESTKKAADRVAEKIRDLMSDTNATVEVGVDSSAHTLIGQKVSNIRGETIGKVEDVLVDANGNATQVVLANGGLMGIGAKLVALDYSLLYTRNNNSEVMIPLSDETIKSLIPFTYDKSEASAVLHTMGANQMSAKAILAGNLLDSKGRTIASIDDVTLNAGRMEYLIVSYGTTMGMGGHKAALAYPQAQGIVRDGAVDFKLSDVLSARFDALVKSTK